MASSLLHYGLKNPYIGGKYILLDLYLEQSLKIKSFPFVSSSKKSPNAVYLGKLCTNKCLFRFLVEEEAYAQVSVNTLLFTFSKCISDMICEGFA